jgi:hypothetical protein
MMANAAVDLLTVPLTFTAEEAGAAVALNTTGITIPGMHYRMGTSGLWMPYTAGAVIDLPNIGDSCQFWNSESTLSTSLNDEARFSIYKKVRANGNCMSLLNWIDYCPDYCFSRLFEKQSTCSGEILLPAKRLGMYCHYWMLGPDCRVTAKLPATTLSESCYRGMFGRNNTLQSIVLPATKLVPYCYYFMFEYGGYLSEIKVSFTEWHENATTNWVNGVSKTGTFYKPSALPEEYGISRIPEGWTVVNID